MGMAWAYQKPWEDFFTVVNWDRRGVGKSFAAADSARLAPTLTLQQHVDDALVVVEHLLSRFGQEKLVVLGYEVPVVMLHGRFDLHTPYESALDYFNRIDAPHKRFVTFERSSHMIMFEEPGRMLMTLVNEVLPLAGGPWESAGS